MLVIRIQIEYKSTYVSVFLNTISILVLLILLIGFTCVLVASYLFLLVFWNDFDKLFDEFMSMP